MPRNPARLPGLCLLALAAAVVPLAAAGASAPAAPADRVLVLDGLGKGAAPLDGAWQFHLGDDTAWAAPSFDDSQWEQLSADKTWGSQTHPSYQGMAWYRRTLRVTPAPGASPDFALLIPAIDDAYEIYWNGTLIGHLGSMPPHPVYFPNVPAQTYGLGPMQSGVLAIRVWKNMLASNDPSTLGGFEGVPLIGSPDAIAAVKGDLDFHWLRSHQFLFGFTSLYTLVALLSLIAWLRDRRQWLLLWMAIFAFCPLVDLFLNNLRLPFPGAIAVFLTQTEIQVRECSQWLVFLWLLQLNEVPKLVRFTRIAVAFCVIAGPLDGMLSLLYPVLLSRPQAQIADAFLTGIVLPFECVPVILVAVAIYRRMRLDSGRWAVASFAFLGAMIYSVQNISGQGKRFTHWTLDDSIAAPLITVIGNPINLLTALRTLLFLSIVYAVIRSSVEHIRRRTALEREFQNARELQKVLIPEELPAIKGFAVTSAYRPSSEVGGDFFQIIPLEGKFSGSTLVVLGDVSGKGLKAAMAVSLIVGMVRALADTAAGPGALLAELNRRLSGKLQGAFATCIALRLDSGGRCVMACAGHPSPYINGTEFTLSGAFPLGIDSSDSYEERSATFTVGDHFAIYTDGLLEARSDSGELYGFDRLRTLFAAKPNAQEASSAAVEFGQNDDITVLTLTRLAVGERSTTQIIALDLLQSRS
jgi:hypothetical protein